MKITSIKHPIIEQARELQTATGRKKHKKILLYGREHIEWAYNAGLPIEHIFVQNDSEESISKAIKNNTTIVEISEGILKKISGTNYVVPIMAVASIGQNKNNRNDFLIVLDNLQDFGNIGTIVRTARGLSVNNFLFSGMQADPFQRKVIDASRGLVLNSSITEYENIQSTLEFLKNNDYQIVVTSPHAKKLQSQTALKPKKIALVVGNETNGICKEFIDASDIAIQIPMDSAVESLNVSVSAGISIYELKFKQVLMMLKEKIVTNFGRQVNVTGKLIRMAFDQEIKKNTDFSGEQAILLMIMHCDGSMSQNAIIRDMGLLDNELESFLEPLLHHAYITEKNNEYELTSDGQRFIAEIWPIIDATHEKIMKNLNESEIEQLNQLLEKVQSNCLAIMNDKKHE